MAQRRHGQERTHALRVAGLQTAVRGGKGNRPGSGRSGERVRWFGGAVIVTLK